MQTLLTQYAQYNVWANQRIAQLLADADAATWQQPLVHSFPTLEKQILHLLAVEILWYRRLVGENTADFKFEDYLAPRQVMLDAWVAASRDLAKVAARFSQAELEEKIAFTTFSYGAATQSRYEMLHHCLNHSTYHRGQLVMMAKQLGIEPVPPTDFIFYTRENVTL